MNKTQKITPKVADNISKAMSYYLDSEEPPPPKAQSSSSGPVNPPAPPPSSGPAKGNATVPKKSRIVKPKAPGNTSSAAAAAMSMLNSTGTKKRPTTMRTTVTKSNPPKVALKQTTSTKERSKYNAPPTPDKYVPPTFSRKGATPRASSARSKSATTVRPGEEDFVVSPDKTTVAGSRLYARAKQQQRSIEEKQKAKVRWLIVFEPFPPSISSNAPPPSAR